MKEEIILQDKKSMKEADFFLNLLKDSNLKKLNHIIYNEPNIYKYKILNAHFIIKFEDDFYLKVLKKHGVYDFEFISYSFKNAKTTFGESRDYNLSFFDILCNKYDDIYFDVNTFYPPDFESTETYKNFYESVTDKKGKKHYGVKPDKLIKFIKENYTYICKLIESRVS